MGNKISLFHPSVAKKAIKNLKKILYTKQISEGPLVAEFEKKMDERFDGPYSLMVNSGTSALHLAYILARIKPGDEVLTSVFTCVATNIPLLWIGAKPVFVDIDPKTLNIDPEDIERKITKKTKAIIVVHMSGQPAEMPWIEDIACRYDIPIIEDAAQALGAEYAGRKIGSTLTKNFSVFSFQAVKNLTTGDGGLLRIPDKKQFELSKRLRWFGINRDVKEGSKPDRDCQNYDITEIGFKYNATDIDAAIALAGLEKLDGWLEKRAKIVDYYRKKLKDIPGLELLSQPKHLTSSNWLFHILVERRNDFMKKMEEAGIEVNVSHTRNDQYTVFGGKKLKMNGMDRVEDSYVCLPLHTKLKMREVKYICRIIRGGW